MPSPGVSVQGPSLVQPSISSEAISPHRFAPDPMDAFELLIEGTTEYTRICPSPDGTVCTWNRGAERMEGYRPEEVIGKHFSVFYLAEDRQAAVPERELLDAMFDGLVPVQGWRVRQDGQQVLGQCDHHPALGRRRALAWICPAHSTTKPTIPSTEQFDEAS